MKKRLTALSLAVCLATVAFSGCSGSRNGAAAGGAAETTAAVEPTTAAEAKDETTAAAAAETAAEVDNKNQDGAEGAKVETAQSGIDKLVFTYVTSPLNVPTIIEKDQEIFAKALEPMGISVEYAEITSGADQTQALASGDVQVLYTVGATSVILSAANGADIKVLNMYSRSPKAFCMYSTDDTLTTPESLRGKTIAGPTGTNLHELLVAYLATGGMTLDDVNYLNMSIPDAKAALDGGSLDVALIAGATAYQAQRQGYHLVADGDGLIKAIIAVAVTQKFYDENPDVIEKLAEAQAQIAAYMEENPDETIGAVAAALDLDEEAVREMYPYYDFSLELSEDDIDGFQKTADFMLESGMIEGALDVETLFIR